MSRQNVKNTIFERMLQNIAPHLCCGCGKVGVFLCEDCKSDIIYEPFCGCMWCGGAICSTSCLSPDFVTKVWVLTKRRHVIERAIDAYKFRNVRYGLHEFADLLVRHLTCLPKNTIVTSVPTLSSHQRTRGYDHARLLAQQFASLVGLSYTPLLRKVKSGTQHKVNRLDRFRQAENAYALKVKSENINVPILLIDDIITTGSTVRHAAKALSKLTDVIFVAALAYQPLDE